MIFTRQSDAKQEVAGFIQDRYGAHILGEIKPKALSRGSVLEVAQFGTRELSITLLQSSSGEFVAAVVMEVSNRLFATVVGKLSDLDMSTLLTVTGVSGKGLTKLSLEGEQVKWSEVINTYPALVSRVEVAEGTTNIQRITFADGSTTVCHVVENGVMGPAHMVNMSAGQGGFFGNTTDPNAERLHVLEQRVAELEKNTPKPKVSILGLEAEYFDIESLDERRISTLSCSSDMAAYFDVENHTDIYVQRHDGEWFKINADRREFTERWYLNELKRDGCRSVLAREGKVFLFGAWLSRTEANSVKRHMSDASLDLIEITNIDIPKDNTVAVTDYAYGNAYLVISGRHQVEFLTCPSKELDRTAMVFGKRFRQSRRPKTLGYAYNSTVHVEPNDFFGITDELYEAVRATIIEAPLKEISHIQENQLVIERDFTLEALPISECVLRNNGYEPKGKLYKFTLTQGGCVYVQFNRRNRPNVLELDPTTYRELGKLTSRPTKDILFKHCVRVAQSLTDYSGE